MSCLAFSDTQFGIFRL